MDKKFFDNRLLYYGLDEFYNNRLLIKSIYMCKSTEEQYFYHLYVYTRAFISDTWKDYIWEYLNGDIQDLAIRDLYAKYTRKKKHE